MSEGSVDFRDRDGAAARVAYRRAGTGPAVVLIHGVGLQKAIWGPQMDALAAGHDVIAMDMPGHGGPSRPSEAPRLSDYADAVLALLDGLGVDRATVVGHSMGALVAVEFALAQRSSDRSTPVRSTCRGVTGPGREHHTDETRTMSVQGGSAVGQEL